MSERQSLQTPRNQHDRKWTLVASILGLSVTTLDETVVFIAIPTIERHLQIGLAGQQWVVNAYMLALAAFILFAGSLADTFGRRRMFLLGALIFGGGSLAGALAPTGTFLIGARAVQGLGAALLMPTTLALITARYRGGERAAAIGSWAAWGGVAAALGPLVGGALTDLFGWRAIFLLNIPIIVAAGTIGLWRVDESRRAQAGRRDLDIPGAVLAALALGAFSYAAIQGNDIGWTSRPVVWAALLATFTLPAFLFWEHRSRAPMLPLRLFGSRNFTAANAATLGLYGAFNGSFFILMIYLQSVLGYSALQAGLATLPMTVLFLLLSSRLGRVAEWIGPRVPMAVGQGVFATGLVYLGLLEPGQGYWLHVLPGVLALGLALPLAVPPLTNTAMSSAPEARAGTASGVNNMAARLAGLLAIALLGIVYTGAFRGALEPPDPLLDRERAVMEAVKQDPTSALDLSASRPLRAGVDTALIAASQSAYRYAMLTAAGLVMLGAFIALLGIRDPPERMRLRDLLKRT